MAAQPEQTPSLLSTLQSEVSTEASPMLDFLVRNARGIAAGIALCIVAIVGYGVYNWQSGKKNAAEQLEYGRILSLRDPQARLAALHAFLPQAPASVSADALFGLAETAQEAGDHDAAFAAWSQLRNRDSALALAATLGMGKALAAGGRQQEAVALYEELLPSRSESERYLLNSEIALLAEETGDSARALRACEEILTFLSPGLEQDFWSGKAARLRLEQPHVDSEGEA